MAEPVLKKALLAIDPFEREGGLFGQVASAIEGLARGRAEVSVEPVYVFSPAEMGLTAEFSPVAADQYRPAAERVLRQFVEKLALPALDEPRVLVQEGASVRSAVRRLVEHARSSSAQLIVTGTHGRGGFKRFFLGSFAETLVLHSEVPVMTVGPVSDGSSREFRRILFPTDLASGSEAIFDYALGVARQFGARLTAFHTLPNPAEPAFRSGLFLLGGAWVPYQSYWVRDLDERKRKLEAWVERARRAPEPVEADYRIDERGGSVYESVVDFAERERYGLIVAAARSGPVTVALTGSIARQIVRHSVCPVWIVHPEKS